jgi:hypothetical protein
MKGFDFGRLPLRVNRYRMGFPGDVRFPPITTELRTSLDG